MQDQNAKLIMDLVVYSVYFLIIGRFVYLSIRYNRRLKAINEENKKINAHNNKIFNEAHERMNTLSIENNKLREKNEELVERLRNVGLNDIDL